MNCYVESVDLFLVNTTINDTRLSDWINYCQYCSNQTVRMYEIENQRLYQPKDETVASLLDRFPRNMDHCGSAKFGMPFVVSKSQFYTAHDLAEYSFMCYCVESDPYGFQCGAPGVIFPIIQFSLFQFVYVLYILCVDITTCFHSSICVCYQEEARSQFAYNVFHNHCACFEYYDVRAYTI